MWMAHEEFVAEHFKAVFSNRMRLNNVDEVITSLTQGWLAEVGSDHFTGIFGKVAINLLIYSVHFEALNTGIATLTAPVLSNFLRGLNTHLWPEFWFQKYPL
jgi:hypothetical protein